jgi:hypothetical protein
MGMVSEGFPQMDGADGAADPGRHDEDDIGNPLSDGA